MPNECEEKPEGHDSHESKPYERLPWPHEARKLRRRRATCGKHPLERVRKIHISINVRCNNFFGVYVYRIHLSTIKDDVEQFSIHDAGKTEISAIDNLEWARGKKNESDFANGIPNTGFRRK